MDQTRTSRMAELKNQMAKKQKKKKKSKQDEKDKWDRIR